MPRITNDVLDCVIYLYPSPEDAEEGTHAGGTGFLVGIHSEMDSSINHLYAVSNSHVVGSGNNEGQSPVIRLNTREGNTAVLPLTFLNWFHHPDGDDLAVAPLGQIDEKRFQYRFIHPFRFIDENDAQGLVGIGDEVFMAGRLISHEGRQRNIPSVRFGNISIMPWEDVDHPSGSRQKSFLVETRSLSGYSGSPVFIYEPTPLAQEFDKVKETEKTVSIRRVDPFHSHVGLFRVRLLGIDWGHMPHYESVYEKIEDSNGVRYEETEFVAKSNSGQMAVVPAWRLRQLLYTEGFVEMRKQADKELEKRKKDSPFVLDVKKPEMRPFDKESFEEALRRASRKTSSQPDSESDET